MLRHVGHKRTFRHNVRLAALLCLTAGLVNVVGFNAFAVFTSHLTGNSSMFANEVSKGDFHEAHIIGLWLLLFLSGAFTSSFLVRRAGRNGRLSYVAPIILELVILLFVAVYGHLYNSTVIRKEVFAGSLLFAMGLQNAMVSIISGAVVRTTHLTGMFTDLGIELSAIIDTKHGEARHQLRQKITLRIVIISFFLLGGIMGGFLFVRWGYYAFYVASFVLIIAMFYDVFRIRTVKLIKDIKKRQTKKIANT